MLLYIPEAFNHSCLAIDIFRFDTFQICVESLIGDFPM